MEIFVLFAAPVALIWGLWILWRGGLMAGCLMLLLAGTCFGSFLFSLPIPPIPATSDRVLWVLLLGQYALWNRFGLTDPKPVKKVEVFLFVFIFVLLASALAYDWRAHGNEPIARFLFYYLMPVGLYWVARQMKVTERGVLAVFGFLVLFGLYLAITAYAETHQIWALVWPKYIASPEYGEFFGRGRGPVLNPVGTGFFLNVCLCALLMWWPRVDWVGKLILGSVGLILLSGIYYTLTRTVWIGAAGGLFVIIGLSMPKRLRLPVIGVCMLMGLVVVATRWEKMVGFKRDKGLSAKETAQSVELRPILARVAWNMFRDRPIFGCGFSRYRDENIYYLGDRSTDLNLETARPYVQHNAFLSLLTETGLVGAGLFIIVVSLWTYSAWRLWWSLSAPFWARQQGLMMLGTMGAYLPNAMFHDVALIPMFNMVLFFLTGLTVGLLATTESNNSRDRRTR